MQRNNKKTIVSHIKRYEYDPVNEVLKIEFQRGGTYEYAGVPEALYLEFDTSNSRWAFFWAR